MALSDIEANTPSPVQFNGFEHLCQIIVRVVFAAHEDIQVALQNVARGDLLEGPKLGKHWRTAVRVGFPDSSDIKPASKQVFNQRLILRGRPDRIDSAV